MTGSQPDVTPFTITLSHQAICCQAFLTEISLSHLTSLPAALVQNRSGREKERDREANRRVQTERDKEPDRERRSQGDRWR